MRLKEIVANIPGGWYGNDPEGNPGALPAGNVVVDIARIEAAIVWLRRRATIQSTSIAQLDSDGVLLCCLMKP